MNIFIANKSKFKKRLPLSANRITSMLRRVLAEDRRKRIDELNVVFLSTRGIKKINRQFLGHTWSTDVIAFLLPPSPVEHRHSAEIYICPEFVWASARREGERFQRELTRVVIHGLLHILGDRDKLPDERKRMWKRQEQWVVRFSRKKGGRHG